MAKKRKSLMDALSDYQGEHVMVLNQRAPSKVKVPSKTEKNMESFLKRTKKKIKEVLKASLLLSRQAVAAALVLVVALALVPVALVPVAVLVPAMVVLAVVDDLLL